MKGDALARVAAGHVTDRCSPDNPCPERNSVHMLVWGECFVHTPRWWVGPDTGTWEASRLGTWGITEDAELLRTGMRVPDDFTRPWVLWGTNDVSGAPMPKTTRPTLGAWVLAVLLFIHYRRWRARRSR